MDTFSFGRHSETAGNTPAVAAMRTARQESTRAFADVPPAGAVAGVLESVCGIWEEMELVKLQILLRLAQIHSTGNLLEVGGQRTLAKWISYALGANHNQARNMALLAQLLFAEKLPRVRQGLDEGMLSIDEAAAIAKVAEQAVKTRDKNNPDFADADEFRRMIEAGIMKSKDEQPTLSCTELVRLGNDLANEYNPALAEERHHKAFDARRADLTRGFEGTYYFQAWGPDADAELIDKALAAFTKPHDANKPEVSKAKRVYDGFMAMVKSALGHQGCTNPPGPLAMINITVPLDVYTGQRKAGPQRARAQEAGESRAQDEPPQSARPHGPGHATTQDGQVVAFQALQDLAEDSVLRRVITAPKSGKPLDVGRGMRNAPEQVRVVANHGHTTCAWEGGCDVRISDTEADHIQSYSRGGHTSADNIQPLCSTHNRLKYRREKNPHRAVHRGRKAHRKPKPATDPDQPPDPNPRE